MYSRSSGIEEVWGGRSAALPRIQRAPRPNPIPLSEALDAANLGSLKHAGHSTADSGNAYVRSLDLEPDGPLTSVNGCGGKDATIQKTPARDVFGQVAAEQ